MFKNKLKEFFGGLTFFFIVFFSGIAQAQPENFIAYNAKNEIDQATTKNEEIIVGNGWAYFVTPKQLFTEKGTIEKIWITNIAPPISTYTEEEKQLQLAVNQEFGKEFVMAYDHIPDSLEYTDDNYKKPVSERNIDNEDITPYTWKWVHLEMPEAGGGMLTANLRRPNWWLIDNKANKEGNWVKIEIEEMDISGLAQVKDIFPSWVDTRITDFKEEGKNRYRPITGWFERTAPEVWNYVFSTGDTIGSTPNHPFFSEDKQNYIAVGDLSIGERVKLAEERTATLVSKTKRENGPEKVYNLEVWRDHNFHVGVEGLLVHNSCLQKLTQLVDYKKWKRTHPHGTQSEESIAYFVQKLQEGDLYDFYREPILTTTYNGKTYLIDGHHRWEAAKQVNFPDLNHTDILPTPEALNSLTGGRYKNIQKVIDDSF